MKQSAASGHLTNAEYLFVEKVLSDSRILRKDEMDGLLLHIALHTQNAKRAVEKEKRAMNQYAGPEHGKPLLKLLADINAVIDNDQVIRICGEGLQVKAADVIPCGIRCLEKQLCLFALAAEEPMQELRIPLENIESFSVIRSQSVQEKQRAKNYKK